MECVTTVQWIWLALVAGVLAWLAGYAGYLHGQLVERRRRR